MTFAGPRAHGATVESSKKSARPLKWYDRTMFPTVTRRLEERGWPRRPRDAREAGYTCVPLPRRVLGVEVSE